MFSTYIESDVKILNIQAKNENSFFVIIGFAWIYLTPKELGTGELVTYNVTGY